MRKFVNAPPEATNVGALPSSPDPANYDPGDYGQLPNTNWAGINHEGTVRVFPTEAEAEDWASM